VVTGERHSLAADMCPMVVDLRMAADMAVDMAADMAVDMAVDMAADMADMDRRMVAAMVVIRPDTAATEAADTEAADMEAVDTDRDTDRDTDQDTDQDTDRDTDQDMAATEAAAMDRDTVARTVVMVRISRAMAVPMVAMAVRVIDPRMVDTVDTRPFNSQHLCNQHQSRPSLLDRRPSSNSNQQLRMLSSRQHL